MKLLVREKICTAKDHASWEEEIYLLYRKYINEFSFSVSHAGIVVLCANVGG